MNMTKYPGEAFNVPAVVVGENFGTVIGSVHSKFLSLGKNKTAPDLEGFQHLQKLVVQSFHTLYYRRMREKISTFILFILWFTT